MENEMNQMSGIAAEKTEKKKLSIKNLLIALFAVVLIAALIFISKEDSPIKAKNEYKLYITSAIEGLSASELHEWGIVEVTYGTMKGYYYLTDKSNDYQDYFNGGPISYDISIDCVEEVSDYELIDEIYDDFQGKDVQSIKMVRATVTLNGISSPYVDHWSNIMVRVNDEWLLYC